MPTPKVRPKNVHVAADASSGAPSASFWRGRPTPSPEVKSPGRNSCKKRERSRERAKERKKRSKCGTAAFGCPPQAPSRRKRALPLAKKTPIGKKIFSPPLLAVNRNTTAPRHPSPSPIPHLQGNRRSLPSPTASRSLLRLQHSLKPRRLANHRRPQVIHPTVAPPARSAPHIEAISFKSSLSSLLASSQDATCHCARTIREHDQAEDDFDLSHKMHQAVAGS